MGVKKGILAIVTLMLIISMLSISASALNTQDGTTCIRYFYGEGCKFCAKVEPFIEKLEKTKGLDIHKYEIYENRENLVLLNDYFEAFDVPEKERGIPAVFIDNKYLIGDGPILEELEKTINKHKGTYCPLPGEKKAEGISGAKSPTSRVEKITLLTVISAAIVDSINPCAIAVLLILLGTLIMAGNMRKAIKAGLAFTASIYIVYFLFGVGLFSALQITGISYWFYKVIGILAVIIGLANIKDYFWYGAGGFVMEIPRAWRPYLKMLLGKVTSPLGAFVMGFVVCLFELPCTGGPYIFILGLLAEKTTQLAAIPILLLYNIFFILPLLLITILIALGKTSVDKATQWKERNIRLLHLIAGIIMLVLGILVLLGIV